ncbi:hypothetical protein [Natrononativus amylolyticus]|uniref:DUF7853 family protein n=1 Tax=Natrononativus amylolyticus TaxID=2963434 RepID=UPI0020CEF4A4|nr:hypothetical protein [Natrononativus amylolyticus]
MSIPPQETRTLEIDLSREQRWLVHYVLTARADDAIDDRSEPPTWLLEAFETIEAGERTLTVRQARQLLDAVTAYGRNPEAPADDVECASAVVDRLEAALDSL